MKILITTALVLALIVPLAAVTYTAVPLQLPADLANGGGPFITIFGFNNLGQVLGEAGAASNDRRGPVVWTNGVPTKLPIPQGVNWTASYGYFKINNSGDVLGRLDGTGIANGQAVTIAHTYIWKSFLPIELQPPRFHCVGGTPSVGPMSAVSGSFNNEGHVFGATFYLNPPNSPCIEYWVYQGASYREVNLVPVYGPNQPFSNYIVMNDADEIALPIYTQAACSPCLGTVVLSPDGSLKPLSLGFGWPTGYNTRGQWLGFIGTQSGDSHLNLWDPQTGLTDLGIAGGNINNVGQIAYTIPYPFQTKIWDHGVVTNVTFPSVNPPISPNAIFVLINDSGQLAGPENDTVATKYVLSPSGACATDVGAAGLVTRGGFRYNRATQHYTQSITVTNTSAASLTGPFSLALDNVPQSASLFGVAGATLCDPPQGSPYLSNAAATLAPGASLSFTLEFINTAGTGITYSTRVLAGPGGR